MKRLLLATSLALACVAAPAFAHDDDHHRGRGHGRHHYEDDRGYDRRYYRHEERRRKSWKRDHYRRGERIEVVYVEPRYYVDDYHHYHLRQPPRGHRWIRTDDGRFILVAIATGIIADILLHH
jgi:Ni/Co efflux regulator RcnB